jgi:hypothetical protein
MIPFEETRRSLARIALGDVGSVGELEQQSAAKFYANAISLVLGWNRHERRGLAREIDLVLGFRSEREGYDDCEWVGSIRARGIPVAFSNVLMVSEWWDGSGPARVRGENIPRTARIISLAEHWAALTAKGSPQLSHEVALADLEACSGTHYDPAIVRVARLAFEYGHLTYAPR